MYSIRNRNVHIFVLCTFLFCMVYCRVWDRCSVGYVNLVCWFSHVISGSLRFARVPDVGTVGVESTSRGTKFDPEANRYVHFTASEARGTHIKPLFVKHVMGLDMGRRLNLILIQETFHFAAFYFIVSHPAQFSSQALTANLTVCMDGILIWHKYVFTFGWCLVTYSLALLCMKSTFIPQEHNMRFSLMDSLYWYEIYFQKWPIFYALVKGFSISDLLDHWLLISFNSFPPLDKMAAILADDISKRIFLNENLWFFLLKFHWGLFQRVQLTITQHWFR